jgi:hypothetical protein
MNITGIMAFILALVLALPEFADAWIGSSFINHHGKLAVRAEKGVQLPRPLKKRCEEPVDVNALYSVLKSGAAKPDSTDGKSSPFHSLNVDYDKSWDPAIRAALGLSADSWINGGLAITAIKAETSLSKKELAKLTCDSGVESYASVWKRFGILSHYPADLASPLHAYSVGIDLQYHEGDYINGEWMKGLWDQPIRTGQIAHGILETIMGTAAYIDLLSGSPTSPEAVATRARNAMNGYVSLLGRTGYAGLVDDFKAIPFVPSVAGMQPTRMGLYFAGIGKQQASDAIGGIEYAWQGALNGFTPPSNCDEKKPASGCGQCRDQGGCPGGDYPDDTFSMANIPIPATSDERLEQSWDRLAVKKNKQSLINTWMRNYITGEYQVGNLDETAYQRLFPIFSQNPDVSDQLFYDDYLTSPDIAILSRGFALTMSDILQNNFSEPVRRFTVEDFSPDAFSHYPVLVIPSGGLTGLENSQIFKAKLDGYLKQGGTIIVFSQQQGYEFGVLPVPQEPNGSIRPVSGYGWAEDQACFFDSVYIDTYHQILSGQTRNTPSLNVDGYFTSYPSIANVILRRNANGQPAMIMYDHGLGKVIVTSVYSDYAAANSQASTEEITLLRDMILWAKKPSILPEVKPGATVAMPVTLTNNTAVDAASAKLQIYNPERTKLLAEQSLDLLIPAGQSATANVNYSTIESAPPGIYHIDYVLLDSQGNLVQPQAETDSGRFAVSNPPQVGASAKDILLTITSPSQLVFYDKPFVYTLHVFNNTNTTRNLTIKTFLYHTGRTHEWTVTAIPNGETTITGSDLCKNGGETMGAYLYDENGAKIGNYILSFKTNEFYPAVDVTTSTGKGVYARGETVNISAKLKNTQNIAANVKLGVTVTDPLNIPVYANTLDVSLSANGTIDQLISFTLPVNVNWGCYSISTVVFDPRNAEIGGDAIFFEVPQKNISITPNLPTAFSTGSNTFSFILSNIGIINVPSGTLSISLKDKEGVEKATGSQSFALDVAQSTTLDISLSLPSIIFGDYILTYSQSDETKTGKPTTVVLTNSAVVAASFDKPSYRVRETVNVTVTAENTGRFNLGNASISVQVPDTGYSSTTQLTLSAGGKQAVQLSIPLPAALAVGQHQIGLSLNLPSGSSVNRNVWFTVPDSSLKISYAGPSSLKAGDTITLNLENSGGVDTGADVWYSLWRSGDANGLSIVENESRISVPAGVSLPIQISIPPQAVGGTYDLDASATNGKNSGYSFTDMAFEIAGIRAALSVNTDKPMYHATENIDTLSSILNQDYSINSGNLHLEIVSQCPPHAMTSYHFTTWDGSAWVERGVLHYPTDMDTQTIDLSSYLPDAAGEFKVRIRQEGTDSAAIDYVALQTDKRNLEPSYAVYTATNGDILSAIKYRYDTAAWVLNKEIEVKWKDVSDTVQKNIVMTAREGQPEDTRCSEQIFWASDIPINQAAGTSLDYRNTVSPLPSNQYILKGELKSSTGQIISIAGYPFTVIDGDYGLRITSDKQYYRPGETITIKGEAANFTEIESAGVSLYLDSAGWDDSLEDFTIPAKGKYEFSFTTTAGSVGNYTLNGEIDQNDLFLNSAFAKYSVADPELSLYTEALSITDHNPFDLNVYLSNDGNVPATVALKVSGGSLLETRTITLQPGEFWDANFTQIITSGTDYTIEVTGDLNETQTVSVKYGEGLCAALQPSPVYPEGKISIPVVVSNTGLLDNQFTVSYHLASGGSAVAQQAKSYFVAKGASRTDTLYFDLTEGSYQITAQSALPSVIVSASFQVRKETKIDLALSTGVQTDDLLPVTLTATNLGFNQIEGSVLLTLVGSGGSAVWNSTQDVSLLFAQAPAPISVPFSINLSAVTPGNYTLRAELLDNGNRQLKVQTIPFTIQGPTFTITQIPDYQTFAAGADASMTFKVKNNGNQGGQFDFTFKADDIADSSRSEWLKPGVEKELVFHFMPPTDLEEKDYTAAYTFKKHGAGSGEQGIVKYHLAGIKLSVQASLDKETYAVGDTANLTLTVTNQGPGASPNLFARVIYSGYEDKQTFTLSGGQTLSFAVPLTQITGQKLFYGIYHESGRSIHLNTLYIRPSGNVITVTTDRQVYNPGDTVSVTITGSTAGTLILSGPGGYTNTLDYSGSATRSFNLPYPMNAGTYTVNAQLTSQSSGLVTVSTPFDVSGIQVKVKEAILDKGKYSATDTMRLNLTIESNQDLPATIKTWVLDPVSNFTITGTGEVNLKATEPVLSTQLASLATTASGIHRLVYGIYQGELLLASGAEAFDIGEAVLLGLSTDKTDYPEITSPVTAKADLYGTTDGGLAFFLDGTSIKSETVALAGFTHYTFVIASASLTPGRHTLKAVLTTGGLTSTKETSFTSGSNLPDLTVSLSSDAVKVSSLNLIAIVINQGKTPAGATTLALYDGDPAQGATAFATLNVPALAGGATATITYNWNILGKAGDHLIYAVVDPANMVTEFMEANNTAMTSVSLPNLALSVSTDGASFQSNTDIGITVNCANLSPTAPYQNILLRVALTDPQGVTSVLKEISIATLAPAADTTDLTVWNTARNLPGNYTINAVLIGGGATLAANSTVFSIEPSQAVTGTLTLSSAEIGKGAPLVIAYTINNNGNIETTGVVKALVIDPQNAAIKDAKEAQVNLLLNGSQTGEFTFSTDALDMKSYKVNLGYLSQGKQFTIADTTFTVKDSIPPVLSISSLSDGSYTNNEVLNITGTVTDINGVKELLINGTAVSVNSDGSFTYALFMQSGGNKVTTVATDMAGNQASDTRTINLDRTAPVLIITAPSDNSKTGTAPTDVKGSVDDVNATVAVTLGNTTQTALMTGKNFQASVLLAPKENTIEITATDLATNTSSQKRTVYYDDQKPSLAITEPNQDIHTNKSSLAIRGTASDPYGLAVTVSINMDGQTYNPALVNGQFEQVVTFATQKSYAIVVTAANEVGTSTSAQRNVIYDATPPTLSINPVTSPTSLSNQQVTGTMESGVTVTVACPTATVGIVTYPTAATWSVNITNLTSGDNAVTVTASDLSNNATTASANIIYTITQTETTFTFAVFGNLGVTMLGGSYTDSFISTPPNIIRGQYKHGDVGSNSLKSCAIKLSGGTQIFGKAWVGAGGNAGTGICLSGGSAVYNNNTGSLTSAKDMTPKTDPGGGTSMGALNLSNGVTKTLSAGDYRYSSVNLTGGSTLLLNGPITMHVNGNVTISNGSKMVINSGAVLVYMNGQKIDITGGSLVNSTQDPKNLTIYGTAGLQSVNLSGGTNQHILLYAPTAAITLSGGQNTFGSIIGSSVNISNGSSVHYDEVLSH